LAAGALLVAASAASAGTPAEELLAGQPGELIGRLEVQKVVVLEEVSVETGRGEGFFLAYVIFETSAQRAYELLADTPRHAEFRPEIRAIETVAKHPGGNTDSHRLKVLFLDATYWIRYEKDPAGRSLRWTLDTDYPNRLKYTEGFWEFYEMEGGRTLGRFGASIDVGPALPQFFQNWVTRKNLPRTIERARLWVDSDGSYRP